MAGAFCLGSVGLSVLSAKISGQTYEMFYFSYGIFPMTVMAAILLSLAVIILSYRVRMRPLSFLGRNSMIYFAFHQSIGIPLALGVVGRIPSRGTIQGRLMHFLIIYLLVIAICAGADAVIRHSPLRFMAGK